MVKLTIIIRTFNEGKNIARTLECVSRAVRELDAEVIVSDSLSADDTVEVASRFPVGIVQLLSEKDRSAGSSFQIGFQVSRGEYLYLLDGDMELHGEFLRAAIEALDREPTLAGVGGIVRHVNRATYEFKAFDHRHDPDLVPGPVSFLAGGGLYRRRAIDSVAYLNDRNLQYCDDLELALRLRHEGWTLKRLNMIAVDHHDHTDSSYKLLWRRLRSRYASGVGGLIRATIGKPYFGEVLKSVRLLHLSVLVYLWLAVLAALILSRQSWLLLPTVLIAALPFAVMIIRRNSVSFGVYSVVAWCVYALGTLHGLFSRRHDPRMPIAYRVIRDDLR